MQRKEFFIGVDVSKETLDVAVSGSKSHIRIKNNSEGFKQLQAWLKSLQIALSDCWFVLEYTGGYEYRLVDFCKSKQIQFTRVPGLAIKKSLGMQRGKNDKLDAKRIAEYGEEKQKKLKPHTACAETILRLKQLLTQREAFINDRKGHEHRMKELQSMMDLKESNVIIRQYKQAVVFMAKMEEKTEEAIHKLISGDSKLDRNYALIMSVPGIGKVNAWMTIAYTENFECFDNARQYGAYCGVVPYDHESGKSIKKKNRISHMANKPLKACLTMGARSAINNDEEMKQYYQRRVLMGKHHNSIVNEIRFKLILRMFAVVNKQEFYVDKYEKAA